MKLLIDIPEHVFEHAKEGSEDSRDEATSMRAIANGAPLKNEHDKKLIESANYIKEHCENTDFCDGCVFYKLEIERDEYTNETINHYRFCELERKTHPCNWKI